ncbi:hypothetical protein VUR80DRAFT_9906 [Thermomyces stellatus]
MLLATDAIPKIPCLPCLPVTSAVEPGVDSPPAQNSTKAGGDNGTRSLRLTDSDYYASCILSPLIDRSQRISGPCGGPWNLGCRGHQPQIHTHTLAHVAWLAGRADSRSRSPTSATQLPLCDARRGMNRPCAADTTAARNFGLRQVPIHAFRSSSPFGQSLASLAGAPPGGGSYGPLDVIYDQILKVSSRTCGTRG